jgi:D-alanyl-D-alanine dipeptidase
MLLLFVRFTNFSKHYMKRPLPLIVFAFLWSLSGVPCLAGDLPDGFVYLQDVIPGITLEIRYYTADNFVGRRIRGYESPVCILSRKAAQALSRVQAELNAFYLGLMIYDAYRPQQAVDHFVKWAKDLTDTKMKAEYYPDVNKKDLFRDGYIAQKSSHSRGSTVDVTIVSLGADARRKLDMGTPWDFFGPRSWPGSRSVSPAQRAHRMLLQKVMTAHGFRPLKEEWWHFTLGDEPFPNQYFNFAVK